MRAYERVREALQNFISVIENNPFDRFLNTQIESLRSRYAQKIRIHLSPHDVSFQGKHKNILLKPVIHIRKDDAGWKVANVGNDNFPEGIPLNPFEDVPEALKADGISQGDLLSAFLSYGIRELHSSRFVIRPNLYIHGAERVQEASPTIRELMESIAYSSGANKIHFQD